MNYYGLLDERLQESVWETRIPLKIKMNSKDLISSNIPLTLYYSLPRVSYLSSIFGDIIKNFEGCVQVNLADLWIECENKPLRWQYPLGVLVDSLGIDISRGPITLTVRLREMPKNQVLEYTSMGALRFYFFGALKEADVIRYPIDKKAFEMGKDRTERLEKLIYENNPKNIIDYRKIMTFEVFNRTDIVFVKAAEIKEENGISYTLCDFLNDALKKMFIQKLRKDAEF